MRNRNNLLLLLILITGALLRLLFIAEIPFTRNEFSTIAHPNPGSFPGLAAEGFSMEGQQGLALFLHYWTMWFGMSEIALKLPFIIMGILSILMIFFVGKEWYNETAGLIIAAFWATLQFAVMSSQIAGPFASGMFLCLSLIFFWSRLIFKPGTHYWLNFSLYVFLSVLCVYNHPYSLLFAAVVALTGLFFIRKKRLLPYLIALGVTFFLSFSQRHVIFIQSPLDGINIWPGSTINHNLLNFIGYLFHYSTLVYLLAGIFAAFGFYRREGQSYNFRMLAVAGAWLVLPVLAGFVLSRYTHAPLQTTILIFSLPCIFFILFGHWKNEPFKINAILVGAILLVNISTLVLERRHFELMTRSPYEQILTEHQKAQQEYPGKVLSLLDSDREIAAYYLSKNHINTPFVWQDTLGNLNHFSAFLKQQQLQVDYIYFGSLVPDDPLLVPIIMDFFPNLIWQKNYCGGTAYLFARSEKNAQVQGFSSKQGFEAELPNWNTEPAGNITDSAFFAGKHAYLMDSRHEFGPSFSASLKDLIRNEHTLLDISLRFLNTGPEVNNLLLVSSLVSGKDTLEWHTTRFDDFTSVAMDSTPQWTVVHQTLQPSTLSLKRSNTRLNVTLWNKAGKNCPIDDFEIRTRYENPLIFGLYEKF